MSAGPIGIVSEQTAKRAALVDHLSPAAKHAHFPKIYAKPMPFERLPTNEELCELHRLRLENTNLKAKVSGLEARVEILLLSKDKVAAGFKINVNDAFPKASVDQIMKIICKHWAVNPGALRSVSRERRFVRPRQAAYRMLHDVLHLSHPAIGRFFNRDHTTVIHGLRKTEQLANEEPVWRERYDAALAELKLGAEQ